MFLLGITPRSGTDYLRNLLCCHPDFALRQPLWEDHLLEEAEPLVEFIVNVVDTWQEHGVDDADADAFAHAMGRGVTGFLTHGADARWVIAKTPSTRNALLAPMLFPDSPIVFLVRDGRSVCESMLLSWGINPVESANEWATNGRTILHFLAQHGGGETPYLLLRYEDVFADPPGVLAPVFTALGVDPARFDSACAVDLPVRGSSVWRGGAAGLHWDPVPRGVGFEPLARHRGWTASQHSWFRSVAGDVLDAFGYDS